MKNILVVSDTHGNKKGLNELVKSTNFDFIFFLGDLLGDVDNLSSNNVIKVRGNWDYTLKFKTTEFVEIEGVKFMLTHGHKYFVKNGLGALIKEAQKNKVDVVCYGHTHKQDLCEVDGIKLLNPGAFSSFKGGKFTYAIINVDNKKIYVNMLNNLK